MPPRGEVGGQTGATQLFHQVIHLREGEGARPGGMRGVGGRERLWGEGAVAMPGLPSSLTKSST